MTECPRSLQPGALVDDKSTKGADPMGYTFEADGRTWHCLPAMPEDLWVDYWLLFDPARPANRRKRKLAGNLTVRIVATVVVGGSDLCARAETHPEVAREISERVMPALLDHYQAVRESGS